MQLDIGAKVTALGRRRLNTQQTPVCNLRHPSSVPTFNADGTSSAPALGTFQASLFIGKQACLSTLLVHKEVTTPLSSRSLGKELAIIPKGFPRPIMNANHASSGKAPHTPDASPWAPINLPTPTDELGRTEAVARTRAIMSVKASLSADESPHRMRPRPPGSYMSHAGRCSPANTMTSCSATTTPPGPSCLCKLVLSKRQGRHFLPSQTDPRAGLLLPLAKVREIARIQDHHTLSFDKVGTP